MKRDVRLRVNPDQHETGSISVQQRDHESEHDGSQLLVQGDERFLQGGRGGGAVGEGLEIREYF